MEEFRISFTVAPAKVFDVIAEAPNREAMIATLGNRMAALLMSDPSIWEKIGLDAVWGIKDVTRDPVQPEATP